MSTLLFLQIKHLITMANKSLVILRNGFDKALKFPTGYYDFYRNTKELKPMLWMAINYASIL